MENFQIGEFFKLSRKHKIFLTPTFSTSHELNKLNTSFKKLETLGVIRNTSLTISEFKSLKVLGSKIFFARVVGQFQLGDKKSSIFVGSGESITKEQAAIKAFSEFFERLSGHIFNLTRKNVENPISSSNGCAFHKSITLAKQNSYEELIERDAFLVHWYTRTKSKQKLYNSEFEEYFSTLSKGNFEFQAHELHSIDDSIKCVFTILKRRKYEKSKLNMILGLGADRNLNDALFKAFNELNRFFNLYYLDEQDGGLLETRLKCGVALDVDRLLMFQKKQYEGALDFFTNGHSQKQLHQKEFLNIKPNYINLPVPNDLSSNFITLKCSSIHIQELDYLSTPILNESRLKLSFPSYNLNKDTIPHPIP